LPLQGSGFAASRHGNGHAEHIGEELRPDRAARAAAGQHHLVEIGARFVQGLDMALVLEGDALEQRTKQMCSAVPAGDAVEAGIVKYISDHASECREARASSSHAAGHRIRPAALATGHQRMAAI
jgi:hypothetical protein